MAGFRSGVIEGSDERPDPVSDLAIGDLLGMGRSGALQEAVALERVVVNRDRPSSLTEAASKDD
jgi:hypothetical protein